MSRAEEMLTTAGRTALTTGENVPGIVAASRTGGAAAATAASGARPAWMETPRKAPPAIDARLIKSAAMTQAGYLVIRFIIVLYPSTFWKLDTKKNQTDGWPVRKRINGLCIWELFMPLGHYP